MMHKPLQRRRALVSERRRETNSPHCVRVLTRLRSDFARTAPLPSAAAPPTPTRSSTFPATTIPFERSESSEEKEPLQT